MKNLRSYFPKEISKKQAAETGMVMVLILLLSWWFTDNTIYCKIAVPVLIIDMIFPWFYYPFAFIWFGFSQILGSIVSKIILTIIFITMVIPIGMIRRIMGIDSLKLSKFKKGQESVMKIRDHSFTPADIETPY